ncbi:MAG: hypothetical protein R3E83_25480 [Burkholderiaceae bacterium]
MNHFARRTGLLTALIASLIFGTGCTVITVAGAAVGVAATVAETAVDVTVGTVKLGAKAVGSVLPGDEEE